MRSTALQTSKSRFLLAGMDLKAAWYGAEIFGKLVGGNQKPKATDLGEASAGPITWETALKEIRADFDNNYFVSGDADMSAYDPQCEFADPFVSFNGVDRFKTNLSNFSKVTYALQPHICMPSLRQRLHFRTCGPWRLCHARVPCPKQLEGCGHSDADGTACRSDVVVDITKWEEIDDLSLKVSWRFRCILDLPWRPILAAAGAPHLFRLHHIIRWGWQAAAAPESEPPCRPHRLHAFCLSLLASLVA